jgi:hypothetical protein
MLQLAIQHSGPPTAGTSLEHSRSLERSRSPYRLSQRRDADPLRHAGTNNLDSRQRCLRNALPRQRDPRKP